MDHKNSLWMRCFFLNKQSSPSYAAGLLKQFKKNSTLLVIRRLALFNMVYWNKGLYYHGLETRKIKNERLKTKKTNKEMISCRSHQSWFVLFMLLTRFYSCKQFIHVVSLGTRIAQSFGIPKTAEKLGFFRLQL